jgi:hypothetical protein
MTNDQAKEILRLYRPGSADATDPSFAEALAMCESDAELKRWFAEHCALYAAMRSKFKAIAVPEGLKEQIIAERKVHVAPLWQRVVIGAGAVAALVLVTFTLKSYWPEPREPHDFAAYENHMAGEAIRGYYMDLYTNDLDSVRVFLSQAHAPADYVLPENLMKNARAAGCVAKTWQGKRVSMICFTTGRPLPSSDQSDLWLFVSERSVTEAEPAGSTPRFEKLKVDKDLIAASWTIGNRTYVLATKGDQQFLNRFL